MCQGHGRSQRHGLTVPYALRACSACLLRGTAQTARRHIGPSAGPPDPELFAKWQRTVLTLRYERRNASSLAADAESEGRGSPLPVQVRPRLLWSAPCPGVGRDYYGQESRPLWPVLQDPYTSERTIAARPHRVKDPSHVPLPDHTSNTPSSYQKNAPRTPQPCFGTMLTGVGPPTRWPIDATGLSRKHALCRHCGLGACSRPVGRS